MTNIDAVPDDMRDEYGELGDQLRAAAEVVADVMARVDDLKQRMRDTFGAEVPGEAWDECGASTVARLAELVRLRLASLDAGIPYDPEAVAAEHDLPDDYVSVMRTRLEREQAGMESVMRIVAERDTYRDRVFHLVTNGLGGD